MATTAASATAVLVAEPERLSTKIGPLRRSGILIRQNPLGFFGVIVVLVLGFCAAFAPILAPYDPNEISVGPTQADPSMDHYFGTDELGRDIFSRVLYGARISLAVGFLAVAFGTILGTMLGVLSGYAGGVSDSVIQRGVDIWIAFPILLLLLILRQILGASVQTLIIAVGIAIIPGVARVVRGAVLSERNNQYVEAARSLGASTPRILLRHIAPNILALSIIIMTSLIGTAILAEAALAFLGLGVPSSISWGQGVNEGRNTYPIHIWHPFFYGAAIAITVLAFNLLGDALRDIFDPRLRGRL